MQEIRETAQQRMLIPVLIGGAAMALISYIPFVNFINLFCCAGIMGAAVLGVWFYKKSYPKDMAFGPAEGAKIGALSGVVGSVVYSLLSITAYSSISGEFNRDFEAALEEQRIQLEAMGQDPQAVEQASRLVMDIMGNPWLLFAVTLGFALIFFVGFGAIGGAIAGKIFKTTGDAGTLPPMHGTRE